MESSLSFSQAQSSLRPSRSLLRDPRVSRLSPPTPSLLPLGLDSAPALPSPSPGAVARGERSHWLRLKRGLAPAALIGRSDSAEPESPVSRWGKQSRHPAQPERQGTDPASQSRQIGARRSEPGLGGMARRRVARGGSFRGAPRCGTSSLPPRSKKQGIIFSQKLGPPSFQDAISSPQKKRVSHLLGERNSFVFASEMGP